MQISDGSYKIQVCASGAETSQCDSSDSYFTITSLTPTNSNPVLAPTIAVPSGMSVGKSYNFSFSATDADNDNLAWKIDWGDSQVEGTPWPSNLQQKQGWTYSPSHTWNTAWI